MKKLNLIIMVFFVVLFLVSCTSAGENLPAVTQTSTVELVKPSQAPMDTFVPAPSNTLSPTDTETPIATAEPSATPVPTQTLEPPQIDPALKVWLQENAIPFNTTKPESGLDDLQPLKAVIGDARIVALGEATHGTYEFNQMRHRLLEFLVKEMDFTVFAVESNWADIHPIDHYVQTGEGDPETLMANLKYFSIQNQEMFDLIEWMRRYNMAVDPADRIHFAGFDMQSYQPALDHVHAYISQFDPDGRSDIIPKLNCAHHIGAEYADLPQEERDACRSELQVVYDLLVENQAAYIERSSADEFAFALQSLRVVQQAQNVYGNRDGLVLRDRFMAENIAWLLEYYGPDAKVVAWAHNGHVAAYPNGGTMGSFLRSQFGEELVSVGFEFSGGEFIALDWEGMMMRFRASPPPKESLANFLRAAEMPMFVLDLRSATQGIAAEWLTKPNLMHSIGAVYDAKCPGASFYSPIPAKTWDLLIYFENTTAAHRLLGIPSLSGDTKSDPVTLDPTNLGFEAGTTCWHLGPGAAKDYLWKTDKTVAHNGENSLSIRSRHAKAEEGAVSQVTDVTGMRGATIRLTAALRVDELEGDIVLYFTELAHFNITTSEKVLDQSTLSDIETSEWVTVELIVDLSEEATSIAFGVKLVGSGQIWVDDFTLEVVDSQD